MTRIEPRFFGEYSLPRPYSQAQLFGFFRAARNELTVFGFEAKQLLGQLSNHCSLDGFGHAGLSPLANAA